MEKIYITGTGRCGTTFLIKLFTFLNFDTGFTKENYENYISKNCNSGMEWQKYNEKYSIIKHPKFINNIQSIVQDKEIKIKQVIIPIREYRLAAKSRVNYEQNDGGLWNANDEKSQLLFFHEIIANYIYYMTKYEINTLFLDFDKMTNDKYYLFDKLNHLMKEQNVTFDTFSSVYDEVTSTCKLTF